PTAERLTLLAGPLDVCEVAVCNFDRASVQGDPASLPVRTVAVNVATIELNVVRQRINRLFLARAELDDVALPADGRAELDRDKAKMVRARCGIDDRLARNIADQFRQRVGILRRAEPLAGGWQLFLPG